jgi:hypothetical protein
MQITERDLLTSENKRPSMQLSFNYLQSTLSGFACQPSTPQELDDKSDFHFVL